MPPVKQHLRYFPQRQEQHHAADRVLRTGRSDPGGSGVDRAAPELAGRRGWRGGAAGAGLRGRLDQRRRMPPPCPLHRPRATRRVLTRQRRHRMTERTRHRHSGTTRPRSLCGGSCLDPCVPNGFAISQPRRVVRGKKRRGVMMDLSCAVSDSPVGFARILTRERKALISLLAGYKLKKFDFECLMGGAPDGSAL